MRVRPLGASISAAMTENDFTDEAPPAGHAHSWMARARCRGVDTDVFFPSEPHGVETAQRICAECPVQAECLEYALRYQIMQGIWGGTSERARRRILRRRTHALQQSDEPPHARTGRA